MGYLLFRMYYFPNAKNEWDAQDLMREAEEQGVAKDYFVRQWAKEGDKENRSASWKTSITNQLIGKRK
jgi:hypothetical protein